MECFFKSELSGAHKRSRQTEGSLVNDLDVSCKEYLILLNSCIAMTKIQEYLKNN